MGGGTDLGQAMNDLTNFLGRRVARRNQIFAGAELLTPSCRQLVLIVDISVTGAKLRLRNSVGISLARISWEGNGIWGEIVWFDGTFAGMRFDQSWAPKDLFTYTDLKKAQDLVGSPELVLKSYFTPPIFSDYEKSELSGILPDDHQIGP